MSRPAGAAEALLFTARMRAQLAGEGEATAMRRLGYLPPHFRTDALFGLGADLSDTVAAYAAGRVNETVVREAAVQVAVEAFRVWAASCTVERKGEEEDGR